MAITCYVCGETIDGDETAVRIIVPVSEVRPPRWGGVGVRFELAHVRCFKKPEDP